MKFDELIAVLARWRLRYNNGSLFTSILVQLASLETFAKVFVDIFSSFGIPPMTVYICIPLLYVGGTAAMGLAYELSRWWEKEMSHQNLVINKEIREMLVQIRESHEILKKMEKL
jgi:hypothetical protein